MLNEQGSRDIGSEEAEREGKERLERVSRGEDKDEKIQGNWKENIPNSLLHVWV